MKGEKGRGSRVCSCRLMVHTEREHRATVAAPWFICHLVLIKLQTAVTHAHCHGIFLYQGLCWFVDSSVSHLRAHACLLVFVCFLSGTFILTAYIWPVTYNKRGSYLYPEILCCIFAPSFSWAWWQTDVYNKLQAIRTEMGTRIVRVCGTLRNQSFFLITETNWYYSHQQNIPLNAAYYL